MSKTEWSPLNCAILGAEAAQDVNNYDNNNIRYYIFYTIYSYCVNNGQRQGVAVYVADDATIVVCMDEKGWPLIESIQIGAVGYSNIVNKFVSEANARVDGAAGLTLKMIRDEKIIEKCALVPKDGVAEESGPDIDITLSDGNVLTFPYSTQIAIGGVLFTDIAIQSLIYDSIKKIPGGFTYNSSRRAGYYRNINIFGDVSNFKGLSELLIKELRAADSLAF